MKEAFKEQELPLTELRDLGLYDGQVLNLSTEDKQALLSGRRTEFISLKNLSSAGAVIPQLDVKLSLSRKENEKVQLLIHPIYKEAQQHALLTETEAEKLIRGEVSHIQKSFKENGEDKTHIVEYDAETREFLSYDPSDVALPQKINDLKLREQQQEAYQRGEVVQLDEGFRVQHRAGESKGLLSDRPALALSVLLDGGVSYLLLRGINSFNNRDILKRENENKESREGGNHEKQNVLSNQLDDKNQYRRGYSRNSSR